MSLIINEYLCPEHGRFEKLVERDAADEQPCPAIYPGDPEGYGPDGDDEPCDRPSPWVVSAPRVTIPCFTVVRGTSDERPPGAVDTSPLADGMHPRAWRKMEQAKNREIVRDKLRKELL